MLDNKLETFVHLFSNLNPGGGKIKDPAPHKPILLLTIIQAYENKLLTTNQIPITPELTSLFKSNWNLFVTTNHTLGFALPFFHMKNEKGAWWELIPNQGCELWVQYGKLTSFGNLSTAVAYAQIDSRLSNLLHNKDTRTILRRTLLDVYFKGQTIVDVVDSSSELDNMKREMFEESPVEYKAKLKNLKTRLDPETYLIEVYARDTIFRREIIRLYDDTCCITGIRVSAPYTFSIVDACHIVPFAKTFNNHPTNGIALCPNLHRAFDRGAISIDENLRVVVSGTFVENDDSIYSLKSLKGLELKRPNIGEYTPDLEAIRWHNKNIFKRL